MIPEQIAEPVARAAGSATDVWGEDHVVTAQQGVIVGDRFVHKHVESCAGNPVIVQGCDQRCFIDNAAPADVDDKGRGFHQCQFAGADHAFGL